MTEKHYGYGPWEYRHMCKSCGHAVKSPKHEVPCSRCGGDFGVKTSMRKVYLEPDVDSINRVTVFNHDHTRVTVYHGDNWQGIYDQGGQASLSYLSTDQVALARVLADRQACFIHASGIIFCFL